MSFLARRPVSFAVVLSVFLSSLAVLIPSMTKVVEAAPRTKVKFEVCHRTNAIKNPYRRISVAWSAVDDNGNGHDNASHDGPVFDVTNPQATHGTTPRDSGLGNEAGGGNDRWGDIFYAVRPVGNQWNAKNWFVNDTNRNSGPNVAGQAIFAGTAINSLTGKPACKAMSVKEFIESEREANPSISMEDIMDELDEMEAAEDVPLKTVLGGSFSTWFASCTVNCEDVAVITGAIEEKLPSVTTEPPTSVTGTTATLNGTVAPLGTAMQWYFEYVPTTNNFADSNNAIEVTPLVNANASTPSSPPQAVTANITGLTSGTTYYYRTVGLVTSGSNDTLVESYTYGVVKQFNVNAPGSPTITGITCGSTTLSVAFTAPSVNAGGITAYEYSLDGGTTFTAAASATSPISITGLTNGTQYSVAIRAKAGSVIGLDSTVTNAIPCGTPAAVTDPATSVSQQTATLHGNLTANGNPVTVTFVWGTDSNLATGTTTTAASPGTLLATANEYPVVLNLTGLTGSTTYYFKVVGTPTSGSAVEGSIRQFTTTAAPVPAVTTQPATSVTSTTATINGTGTSNGAVSTVTFTWGTDSTLTTGNNTATASQSPLATSASGAAVTAALTSLTPGTTYYFRATITNVNGTVDGIIRQFTTAAAPVPAVTTEPATSVTGTTATINGTGTSNGASSTVTFTWGTDSTLTTGNNTATASQSPLATSASGAAVTAALTSLTPGTTYYFRATITNVNGTVDGIIRQFTTETPQAASVATTTTIAAATNNDDALGRVIGTAWFDINRNNRRDPGEPLLPGVDVRLTPQGVTGQSASDVRKQSFVMKTTSAGAFDFSDLPPGTYSIKSILPGEFGIQESWDSTGDNDWEVTVTVVARQTSRGDFAAVGTALATGSVAGGDGGILEATWSGFDQDLGTNDDVTFSVKLSGSGEFTAQGLPQGKYSVKATSRTGRTLASSNTLQITKSGAQLSVGGLTMSVTIVSRLPQTGAMGLSLPLGFAAMLIPVGIASTGLARRRRR